MAMLLVLALLSALPAEASGLRNPFAYGQCTYWAAQMRPDLIGSVWGNAWQWVSEARWNGFPVGSRPEVGAIAVWQPWVDGADGYGHVAYVVRVNGDWIDVEEMHWPVLGRVTYRWTPVTAGMSFIYR